MGIRFEQDGQAIQGPVATPANAPSRTASVSAPFAVTLWVADERQATMELADVLPNETSPDAQLLATIRSLFETHRTDRLSSETIIGALAESEHTSSDGQALTKAQLARGLAPFGIRPTIVHRSRIQVSRGYLLRDFGAACARY